MTRYFIMLHHCHITTCSSHSIICNFPIHVSFLVLSTVILPRPLCHLLVPSRHFLMCHILTSPVYPFFSLHRLLVPSPRFDMCNILLSFSRSLFIVLHMLYTKTSLPWLFCAFPHVHYTNLSLSFSSVHPPICNIAKKSLTWPLFTYTHI
jgi:hypothetical protein